MGDFERIFKTWNEDRDAFLARLFGIFNEKVVRAWCGCEKARYEDLGRPTLYRETDMSRSTLDFTLRDRRNGKTYISELKCELQYENYKRLRLCDAALVDNHTSEAFKRFLDMAKDPRACLVRVNGTPTPVDGAILIWGAVSDLGRKSSLDKYDFADVLSVEEMVRDLNDWNPDHWIRQVENRRSWSNELFNYLLGQQEI